jgi:hypothetical protein
MTDGANAGGHAATKLTNATALYVIMKQVLTPKLAGSKSQVLTIASSKTRLCRNKNESGGAALHLSHGAFFEQWNGLTGGSPFR